MMEINEYKKNFPTRSTGYARATTDQKPGWNSIVFAARRTIRILEKLNAATTKVFDDYDFIRERVDAEKLNLYAFTTISEPVSF